MGLLGLIRTIAKTVKKVKKHPVTQVVGGSAQPLPLSGIVKEFRQGLKEAREQKNYTRLIRMIPYILVGGFVWYVLYKGLMTMDEIKEWMKVVKDIVNVIG